MTTNNVAGICGSWRVVNGTPGQLPQAAERVDNTPTIMHPEEALLSVSELMLDSTSMRQIRNAALNDESQIVAAVRSIVAERGKMHNPVTKSGGVLVGVMRAKGERFDATQSEASDRVAIGQAVVPIVSISAIPLRIDEVLGVRGDRVAVRATAIVFACQPLCSIPSDLSLDLTLAAVDISSLVPQVVRVLESIVASRPIRALVIGCGKAGLAALFIIRDQCSRSVELLAVDFQVDAVERVRALNWTDGKPLVDRAASIDARNALAMYDFAQQCDLVVNVVNIAGTETPTVLVCKSRATVLFFSMATTFSQAALATDALGKDVTMLIGNGVALGQCQLTFDLLRNHDALRAFFEHH